MDAHQDTLSGDVSIQDARDTILKAGLTRIQHKILTDFIEQAESPILAASEVLQRVRRSGDRPVETALLELLDDWRKLVSTVTTRCTSAAFQDPSFRDLVFFRDQSRCLLIPPDARQLVPPEPTYIMSPALVRLLQEDNQKHSLRSVLDAFVTASDTARVLRHLSGTSARGMLANSWLLSPEASQAFQNGHLQVLPRSYAWQGAGQDVADAGGASNEKYHIMRLQPEPYEDDISLSDGSWLPGDDSLSFYLQTEDADKYALPDPLLFKTHCRFVNALHQFHIQDSISKGWPPRQPVSYLDRSVQFLLRHLCPILPHFAQTYLWRRLFEAGKARYPPSSNIVQQLPFGLYAKSCGRSRDNEPQALRLLERDAPSIPAPRFVDSFLMASEYGYQDGYEKWFVMTGLPGQRVDSVLYRMTYAERQRLADDLSDVIRRMHQIPNKTSFLFSSVTGGPIFDRRLGGGEHGCGPYASEADLNAQLAKGIQESYLRQHVPGAFLQAHESVFTHGDLFLSNVLVDQGALSGLVDWEEAAYMPTYWDFTKAMRVMLGNKETQALYRLIWGHEFDEELETERWLWTCFPFGGPE